MWQKHYAFYRNRIEKNKKVKVFSVVNNKFKVIYSLLRE